MSWFLRKEETGDKRLPGSGRLDKHGGCSLGGGHWRARSGSRRWNRSSSWLRGWLARSLSKPRRCSGVKGCHLPHFQGSEMEVCSARRPCGRSLLLFSVRKAASVTPERLEEVGVASDATGPRWVPGLRLFGFICPYRVGKSVSES